LKDDNDILLCGHRPSRQTHDEATGEEAKTIHRMLEYGGEEKRVFPRRKQPLETIA
jgi:hypothetical protein